MISLIATVLNEGDNIHHLMQSILAQTRQPDELVFVDGGSSDGTVETLRAYTDRLPLRVLVEPGCNISEGRNRAIEAATGDILAITDAGVRLDPHWLERLVAPLLSDPACLVSAGFFHADPQTTFEAALGATTLPLVEEIDPATFLPSSRSVAVRREAARKVGAYPEWLDYCEDLIFDFRLRDLGPGFAFVPDAVAHFRPRRSLRAFYVQYYRYARGDGKADLWRKRHAIRYGTYLLGAPLLLILGFALHPLFWGIGALGYIGYCSRPYRRLPEVMQGAPRRDTLAWIQAVLWVPVIRATGDIAKMLGYPVGLAWRRQHQPPDWRA